MKTMKFGLTSRLIALIALFINSLCLFSQNIGIGTNAPGQKLEVSGNIKLGDNFMVEGNDEYKVYRNLATYSAPVNYTGAIVIWTKQSTDCMWSITIKGQEYVGLAFDYVIWGNGLSAYYTFEGQLEMPVSVGSYGGKLMVILGTVSQLHYQPKVTVAEFRQGRNNINENSAENWEIAIYNDLSWISSQVSAAQIYNGVWGQNGLDAYYNRGEVGIGTISPLYPLHVRTGLTASATRAIYGIDDAAGNYAQIYGIMGEVKSTNTSDPGAGVYGYHNSTTGNSAGVKGVSASSSGRGVFGYATDNYGLNFGVYGKTNSPSGFSGYFEGGVGYFDGSVGIGVYPTQKLHVTGGNMKLENTSAYIYLNGTNASTGQAGIQLQKNGTARKTIFIANSTDNFCIQDNPAAHLDFTITPSGNVGISTSAPAEKLHVWGGNVMFENTEAYLKLKATNAVGWSGLTYYNNSGVYERSIVYNNYFDKLYFYNGPSARYDMAIDNDGNIGIGTTEPAEHLEIYGPDFQTLRIQSSTPNDVGIELLRKNSPTIDYVDWRIVNDNALLRLHFSNDDFATNPTDGFTFNYVNPGGVNSWFGPMDDGNKYLGYPSNRWNVVYAVNGTIQTSDLREKDNISDLGYGLAEIMRLHPVSFTWKKWPEQGVRLGLIAQEVETVLQEVVVKEQLVERDEHGTVISEGDITYGMNYDQLIPVLINAIQEQQAQIDVLQRRIEQMEQD